MERTEKMTAASQPRVAHDGSYFDWPALFGGAVVTTAIGLLFAGFGAALGLSAVSPLQGEGSVGWALIIVGAWILITTVVAYAAGGYVAGRMRRRIDGASADEVSARDSMHGAVVWGLGLIFSAWMAAGIVGGVTTAVGNVAEGAASAAGTVAGAAGDVAAAAGGAAADAGDAVAGSDLLANVNPLEIINQRLLRGTEVRVDQNLDLPAGGMAVLGDILRTGEIDDQDRAYLIDVITENSNLNATQVEERVDAAVAEVVQLREEAQAQAAQLAQDAREAADAARRASVLTGFAIAAAFLIAAAAAIWGASLGGRHRDEGMLFAGFRSF